MSDIYVNQTETWVFKFYDDTGALADPVDFSLEIQDPSDGTVYTANLSDTASPITRQSLGIYLFDMTYTSDGVWIWEVETSGNIKPVVANGSIDVLPQLI